MMISRKLIVGLLIFSGLLSLAWLKRPHSPEERFVIPKGASAHAVAQSLQDNHFVLHRWSFLIWVKLGGAHAVLRPGIYALSPSWTGWTLYRHIRQGPPLVRLTFPEGWTARQMAAHLEAKGITPAAEFLEAVKKKNREGFLFPDTYFFDQGQPAEQVIQRMVQRFHEKEPHDILTQAKALHVSYLQIVTMASLVEREAQAPQERPVIAGVFYNRLRKHWRLESCATVEYALGAVKPKLTYKDLEVNSPYNTYQHFGLPPGPICNPGAPALYAAVHPAQTDMMFFVTNGHGTHQFSRYYAEHLAVQGAKVKGKR